MRGCALYQFFPSVLLTTLLTLCASAFADPTFRAALDGANVVFLNAVLRGPGHTARVR